jgi:C-terminal processing protease CtpA/Prc
VLKADPGEALPPALVTSVDPGSPAARAGVRTGDVIVSVDGAPPFTDGMVSLGVFALLYQSYPQHQALRITLRWPVTGATRTVTITPALYQAPVPSVTSKLLDGNIGYVAPDYYIPRTARDLATGHDPDITKALALLKAGDEVDGLAGPYRRRQFAAGHAAPEAGLRLGARVELVFPAPPAR